MKVDFTDPQIWVAISFILFFLIFGKIIWKQLSGFLDNKILEIKHEINQAQQLHKDAKELLAIESKKAQDLDLIIKDIIDESKNKSYEILLENKKKIETQVQILEKESYEKIKVIQNQALEEIKADIIRKATSIAEDVIKSKLSIENQQDIIQQSVDQTKKLIN